MKQTQTPKTKTVTVVSYQVLLLLVVFVTVPITSAFSSTHHQPSQPEPIRINKVFKKTHSRRQADQLVADGRITINDEPVHSAGQRVVPFEDIVRLDGKVVEGWEEFNHLTDSSQSNNKSNGGANSESSTQVFEYIKYWKPLGVTCTTDRRIYDNLIDALQQDGCRPKSRIFPVGRLDKETSGIILMTSDGRLPNAALRGKYKHPKTYVVKANRPVANDDIKRLREGVVITTVAQRDGNRGKPLTAPTLPCKVKAVQLSTLDLNSRYLEITLVEGRNRQIRKMLEAIGYRVMELHRKSFMNLTLENLEGEGDWAYLTNREMEIVRDVLDRAEQEDECGDDEDVADDDEQ